MWDHQLNGFYVTKMVLEDQLPDEPDPDGEQLKAIKDFLASSEGRAFEYVWIDAQSMPQDRPKGSRTKGPQRGSGGRAGGCFCFNLLSIA